MLTKASYKHNLDRHLTAYLLVTQDSDVPVRISVNSGCVVGLLWHTFIHIYLKGLLLKSSDFIINWCFTYN